MARIPTSITMFLIVPLIAAWPVSSIHGAASVPDLNGSWARATFALEPPLHGGQGPLRDSQRRPNEPSYKDPILTPQAAAVSKARYESVQAGKPYATPSSSCWPIVSPLVFRVQEMQLLQGKDHVTLIYMQDHEVRRVRLNATHPEHVTPSWTGDSVGHYEGDTLVVDTVGVKVGPVPVIDQAGSPFSEALHVVERYRLIDGEAAAEDQRKHGAIFRPTPPYGRGTIDPDTAKKGLQVEFTVEDPDAFTTPWSGLVTYRRLIGDWPEAVCAENPFFLGSDAAMPTAYTLDF